MVSTVADDGVPKSVLPPRRSLWDILKPQAAQVSTYHHGDNRRSIVIIACEGD